MLIKKRNERISFFFKIAWMAFSITQGIVQANVDIVKTTTYVQKTLDTVQMDVNQIS